MLPQPGGLLKLMLNLFCINIIEERELCWCDFVKYMNNIVLCCDTCEPICFKLGVLDMTILCSLIPAWMNLMFAQGHRSCDRQTLGSHSVEKLHEASQKFMMVDCVKEMTVKESFMVNVDCLSICSFCFPEFLLLHLHSLQDVNVYQKDIGHNYVVIMHMMCKASQRSESAYKFAHISFSHHFIVIISFHILIAEKRSTRKWSSWPTRTASEYW